jgi:hypothetical protein
MIKLSMRNMKILWCVEFWLCMQIHAGAQPQTAGIALSHSVAFRYVHTRQRKEWGSWRYF